MRKSSHGVLEWMLLSLLEGSAYQGHTSMPSSVVDQGDDTVAAEEVGETNLLDMIDNDVEKVPQQRPAERKSQVQRDLLMSLQSVAWKLKQVVVDQNLHQ